MKRTPLCDRGLPAYTRGEEIFNMVSHIVGGAFSLAVLVTCVWKAASHGSTAGIVTGAIFGFTMLLLYTMSSIYHGLVRLGTAKKVMQVLDHCTIFLLIAGTYTPIAVLGIRPANEWAGWLVLGAVWVSAIVGISLNAVDLRKYRVFSMICYICSGWCSCFAPDFCCAHGLVRPFGCCCAAASRIPSGRCCTASALKSATCTAFSMCLLFWAALCTMRVFMFT